jgi:hypothetical protein
MMMKKVKEKYIFFIFLLIILFVSERIGTQVIDLKFTKLVLLPMIFAVIFTMTLGGTKILNKIPYLDCIYTESNIEFCGKYILLIMLPLMARYGAFIGPHIREIMNVFLGFVLQEFGAIGTVLIGLPIALFLGLKREARGATLGIGREGELAFISEMFTLNSPEGRGVLSIYLIGTLFGAIIYCLIIPLLAMLGFNPLALAMSSGVGSASMMTASAATIAEFYPHMKEEILAFAATSNQITSITGTYMMVFIAYPLSNFLYTKITGEKVK